MALGSLFNFLETRYPGMTKAVLSSCAVTLNLDYIDIEQHREATNNTSCQDRMITEGDEVAIIPPVSSG